MLKRFTLVLALALAGVNSLRAATYYVSNSGSDANSGSQASPWLTIGHADSRVAPGDTVILSGTYTEYPTLSASGTAASPITFTGGATLSGFVLTGNYNVISNLTLSSGSVGPLVNMQSGGNNDKIVNCNIQMNGYPDGIDAWGNNVVVQGCTLSGGGDPSGPPAQYLMVHGTNNLITQNICVNGNDIDFIKVFGGYNMISSNEVYGMANPNYYNGAEHSDFVQMFGWGQYIIVANNYVHDSSIDIGNTEYDATGPGTGGGPSQIHDLYFINNVFCNIGNPIFSGIGNTWFLNNIFYKAGTFQDGPISFYSDGTTRTSAGSQVINNVFLNCGANGLGGVASAGADLTSLNISYNYFGSATYGGLSRYEGANAINGGNPGFVGDAAYNFVLLTNSLLINAGANLYSIFTYDKNGVARPSSGSWDIGAYRYGTSSTGGTNVVYLPPVVTAISQNATDLDPTSPGIHIYEGTVVTFSATASSPVGKTLTWQWMYTVNGGSSVVFQSGSGTVLPVSFTFGTGTAGSSYVWTLQVSDGTSTVISPSQLMVVEAPPVANQGLSFAATSGVITAPMTTNSGGYISQPVQTTVVSSAGTATYNFTITNAGSYVIQTTVNAPSDSANSFYVNIDSTPVDPTMIWDVPVTAGFEQHLISWRGNGTDTANQFVPEVFNLTTGNHQLIIGGREAGAQLQTISLLKVPQPPQGLRVVAAP